MFAIINNFGIKINVNANIKNWLTKECAIKVIFEILVIVNVNVINHIGDIGAYLDYENCKCKKRLIDKLVDECTETTEEVRPAIITLAENENENSYNRSSCTVYTMLFWIIFTINIGGTGAYFVYFYWHLRKDSPYVGFNTHKETTI